MSEAMTVANPFGSAAPQPVSTALAQSDAQRAVAEVQAAMMIARMNPRDPRRAMDLIMQDCTRETLAEAAVYEYSRGGSNITGPSIRLAEVIAQRWGNMQYGVRELDQRDGESVVQAYAWDVESNTRREVTFTVAHVRDTKAGRKQLTDARDIYEMTANQGARRVRACILGVIPGDVVEAALKQCELTATQKADVTKDRIGALLKFFEGYGVTKEMVEKRIQRRVDAITPALFLQLGRIANSLKDGMGQPADWFELAPTIREVQRVPPQAAQEPASAAAQEKVDTTTGEITDATPEPPKVSPAGFFSGAACHVESVQQPAGKDYAYIVVYGGTRLHTWSKSVMKDCAAAAAAGVPMRLDATKVNFPAAPWRVTACRPADESREPGQEG